jgi:hypothetical protein
MTEMLTDRYSERLARAHIRKEDVVAKVIKQRGDQPGLVHIISAMEACDAYEPWHDKQTHRTFLRHTSGKCLHYYFYFIDEILGLIFLRVPTWCPFRLQFYCNGHSWLERSLSAAGIGYATGDSFGQSRASRHLPGQENHAATGTRAWQPIGHPYRGDLYQTSSGQSVGQNV